jgi:hypothetical protein
VYNALVHTSVSKVGKLHNAGASTSAWGEPLGQQCWQRRSVESSGRKFLRQNLQVK